ncbi:Poly [ADP-ribose] polymerase 2, partial [Irineochytrium annulatum]
KADDEADASNIFEGLVFTLTATVDSALANKIKENGGTVVQTVTKKLTHLVATEEDTTAPRPPAKLYKAKERGEEVKIVSEDFVLKSIEKGTLEDAEKYLITVPEPDEGGKKSKRKAKVDDADGDEAADGEEDEPKKKKTRAAKGKAKSEDVEMEDAEDAEEEAKPAKKNGKEKKVDDGPKIAKVIKKGRIPLDAELPKSYQNDYHVYTDGDDIYDCLLNQTDIGNNNNKFYVIQLLKHDSKPTYQLFARWGRVGLAGVNKIEPFNDVDAAIKAFEKRFRDKTQNAWKDRADFVKKSGKYHYLHRDYAEDDEEMAPVEEKPDTPKKKIPESTLEKPIKDLVELIFDMKMMEKEMSEMQYDIKKMPLGKLKKSTIQQGYAALKSIDEELRSGSPDHQTLVELSNVFYTVIPHAFSLNQRPPVIKSEEVLKQKMLMVEALADIEVTTTLLSKIDESRNPADMKYESLKCPMKIVPRTAEEFKLIEKYTENTHGSTHTQYKLKVEEVFELEKEDGFDEVGAKLHNHKLLWHGSRLTNYAGILSQGLRSANYCFTNPKSNTGLMLLCEVALGDENPLVHADYNAGDLAKAQKKHSTLGKGRSVPDPAGEVKLPNGVVVPCGKELANKTDLTLQYNEFIVYDIKQIRLKYLIKMKFNYNK